MQYRRDVDGLRAVAIIPVVIFHSGLHLMPGGFLGVDVFFAISGYLITSVIDSGLQSRQFSLAKFYERRLRRLFPALSVMIMLVAVFSYLFLLPLQMVAFALSIPPVVGFISNIYFYLTIGYFSGAAEWIPLLHTWSLGVEEQYYIMFPFVMILGYKFLGRRVTILFLILLSVCSLMTAIYASFAYPSAAFYLIPTRTWELLVGALVALAGTNRLMEQPIVREIGAVSGILLILCGYVVASSQTPAPGFIALLPVVGAALILAVGRHGATLVGRCLSIGPLVAIGLMSYSLYIWHWPIFVLARIVFATIELPLRVSIVMMGLSVACAWASWRFVERPFRSAATRAELFSYAAGAFIVCLAMGGGIVVFKGFPGRLSPGVLTLARASADRDPLDIGCPQGSMGTKCSFGQDKNPDVSFAIWGDSFSAALRPAIAAAMGEHARGTLYWNTGCPPLSGARMSSDRDGLCVRKNKTILEQLERDAHGLDVIFLVGRWPAWSEGTLPRTGGAAVDTIVDAATVSPSLAENHRVFERALARTVSALTAFHKKVVLIGMPPEFRAEVPAILAMSKRWGMAVGPMTTRDQYIARNAYDLSVLEKIATKKDVYFIDMTDLFCSSADCAVIYKGKPLFSDADHVSYFGAQQFIAPFLKKAIDKFQLRTARGGKAE